MNMDVDIYVDRDVEHNSRGFKSREGIVSGDSVKYVFYFFDFFVVPVQVYDLPYPSIPQYCKWSIVKGIAKGEVRFLGAVEGSYAVSPHR